MNINEKTHNKIFKSDEHQYEKNNCRWEIWWKSKTEQMLGIKKIAHNKTKNLNRN